MRTPAPHEEPFLELSAINAQQAHRERSPGKKGGVLTNLLGSVHEARKDQTLHPFLPEVWPHRSQIPRAEAMRQVLWHGVAQADLVSVDKRRRDASTTQLRKHLPANRGLPDTRGSRKPEQR